MHSWQKQGRLRFYHKQKIFELDLAEASSSLESLSKEQQGEAPSALGASPIITQPRGVSLTLVDELEASVTGKAADELEASMQKG